jgi:DNA-binding response OmpR family regulator
VIVVSARDDAASKDRARELGAADYLVKPVDLAALADTVDQALGRRVG